MEKAKLIRRPIADSCCRRHNSLSGTADEFPIAPSLGELLRWPRYIPVHSTEKLFQPREMCILVTGCGGEGMGKGALPTRFHIHSSKNECKYTIHSHSAAALQQLNYFHISTHDYLILSCST